MFYRQDRHRHGGRSHPRQPALHRTQHGDSWTSQREIEGKFKGVYASSRLPYIINKLIAVFKTWTTRYVNAFF